MYFFYPTPEEVNYRVPVDDVMNLKLQSAVAQVSQFAPSEDRYRDDWDPKDLKSTEDELKKLQPHKDGQAVEEFRNSTGFNQE